MRKETTITITTTPKQLRQIAAKMDEDMRKAILGHECPSHQFYDYSDINSSLIVKLMADQDAWHNHQSGNKSKWK